MLENLNALCYFFRTNAYESINDESSEFSDTILKKITAIRTIIFLDFYEKNMQKEIQNDIEKCKKEIREMVTDPKIKERILEARELTRKNQSANWSGPFVHKI